MFFFFAFTFELETGEPSHMQGEGGLGGGGENATHEKSTHSVKKEAVRWGSSWRTWVSLHLGGANSISSLNADINQSISEERDSQGGLRAAGAVARNAVRTELV